MGSVAFLVGGVEAIAETHHNQSPIRWVSLRALQVALLYWIPKTFRARQSLWI